MTRVTLTILAVSAATSLAQSTDLILHLKGAGPATHLSGKYKCDATGASLGLPPGVFTVRYVQRGDTRLAIVPVNGEDLVFAQVLSGSGSRYVTGRFTWWDAREPSFQMDEDAPDGKISSCKHVGD